MFGLRVALLFLLVVAACQAANKGDKDLLAGDIPPYVIATINQFNMKNRAVCPMTDECSRLGGRCKGLGDCYKDRDQRYACCTGPNTSDDPDNCECCIPDKCSTNHDNPQCEAAGGKCTRYCLPAEEDELTNIACTGQDCVCCKVKSKTTPEEPDTAATPKTCPEGFEKVASQCLNIDDNIARNWNKASRQCRKLGGSLVTVNNPNKLSDFILEKYPKKTFWLGGSDSAQKGVWLWESGKKVAKNFPWGINGLQQSDNKSNKKLCMALKSSKKSASSREMMYVTKRCNSEFSFICEADKL